MAENKNKNVPDDAEQGTVANQEAEGTAPDRDDYEGDQENDQGNDSGENKQDE